MTLTRSGGGMRLAADAAGYQVIQKREPGVVGLLTVARATCTSCEAHDEIRVSPSFGADGIVKKYEHKGWRMGRSPLCPSCNKPSKHKESEKMVQALSGTQAAPKPNGGAPTPDPITLRKIITRLNDVFDADRLQFVGEHSDKTVADELKLAPAVVIGVRETFFGVLKEPDELVSLRNDIKAAEDLTKELVGTLAELRDRLRKIEKRFVP